MIVKMRPVWDIIANVLNEIAGNENHLLKAINEAESKIANQSFLQRALQLKGEREIDK
jgi:maltose-binding protein MalE